MRSPRCRTTGLSAQLFELRRVVAESGPVAIPLQSVRILDKPCRQRRCGANYPRPHRTFDIASLRGRCACLHMAESLVVLPVFPPDANVVAVSRGKEPEFKIACFTERLRRIRGVDLPAKGESIASP